MVDITSIFKSKARKALFCFYFSHPDNEYYLRQLESVLNIPVSIIRKELLRLEEKGIFISKKKGNQTYFYLNKSYPLFKELKSIVFKTIGIKGTLQKALSKIRVINRAFIYGSYAKAEENANSDIDLFVIGKINTDEFVAQIRKIENAVNREINYCLYSPEDWENKKKEKNSFITDIIENPKIFLIGAENDLWRLHKKLFSERSC